MCIKIKYTSLLFEKKRTLVEPVMISTYGKLYGEKVLKRSNIVVKRKVHLHHIDEWIRNVGSKEDYDDKLMLL